MYSSFGKLNYSIVDGNYRLVVECDQGIADMYRSLIPKYYNVNRPRCPAHITVVRPYKETPADLTDWEAYQGESVEWFYEPHIRTDGMYFWLNTFCNRLEDIRLELGLPVQSEFAQPPERFKKYFHVTLVNCK